MNILKKNAHLILLTLIIAVSAILRFYRLDYQSLWYDELYTVNEANPYLSWRQLFYYCQTDQHPPLYFILQRLSFNVLGYTEWAARSVSAIFGVLCVYGMYLLGKLFDGKRLGIAAAIIIAANQYNIRYAHDARPYTLTWFLAIASYLFFIKALRTLNRTDLVWYGIFTTMLLYTSYFGFLLLLAQAIIAFIVWINERSEKQKFFFSFLITGIGILICYIPWYRYLFMQAGLKPFWLQAEPSNFLLIYYYAYFGGERFLIPFLLFAPIAYLYYLYRKKAFRSLERKSVPYIGFLFIIVSVTVPFLVLYVRSELYSPVLQMRYAVVTLPGLFLLVAYGINQVKNYVLRYATLLTFLSLSLYNLIIRHQFYNFPTEMQYRQAAAFMAKGNRSYPVINWVNGWHMKYYMKQNDYYGKVYTSNKYSVLDSILTGKEEYKIDTFWIITGFLDKPLSPSVQGRLDAKYQKVKINRLKNITVELYGKKQ